MELFNDLMKGLDATGVCSPARAAAWPSCRPHGRTGVPGGHGAAAGIQNAVLAEYGLTEELFQQMLMKHSSSQEVQEPSCRCSSAFSRSWPWRASGPAWDGLPPERLGKGRNGVMM